MPLKLFAQLTKVDAEKRLVYGRAVAEVPDRSGEIFDYKSSKPYFEKWSRESAEASDGKSLGNLRAMHGKVAAGKLTGIEFNDAEKAIDVVAHVVDDNEWKKVQEGVYTGFSIGGSYVGAKTVEKVGGAEVKRYTASPSELSLVDRPCVPVAKFFEIQKADGTVEQVLFKSTATDDDEEDALDPDDSGDANADDKPKADKADGGAVEYQVEGSEEDIAKLAKMMTDEKLNLAQVIALVGEGLGVAAAKKASGLMLKAEADGTLQKGMYTISRLADLLASFDNLAKGVKYEEEAEKDYTSVLPEKMAGVVRSISDVLKAMVTEEVAELLGERGPDAPKEVLAMADKLGGLEKVAAKEKPVVESLQALFKKLQDLGLEVSVEGEPISKVEANEDLQKVLKGMVEEATAPLQKTISEYADRIKKLEALPLQPKGVLKAVSKAADLGGTDEGHQGPEPVVKDGAVNDAATEIKKAHQSGGKPLAWGPGGPVIN